MVSWALCSAHSSIMDGKSDTVTAVALRGSQGRRQSERRRETVRGVNLSCSSRKIGDGLQQRRDIHTGNMHKNTHTHTRGPLPSSS